MFSLPVPKCGSEVPSPAGECRPEMVGGGAQIRSVSQSSGAVWGAEGGWEILGFLRARQSSGELGQQEARRGELCAIAAVSSVFIYFGSQFCSCSIVV